MGRLVYLIAKYIRVVAPIFLSRDCRTVPEYEHCMGTRSCLGAISDGSAVVVVDPNGPLTLRAEMRVGGGHRRSGRDHRVN
mmetsp:Transcript_36941/g.92762  ORF Transcript_36941/g.92762 Transcript_36941/m.92762 type:complete len:81 (-) Transcript_36941:58-300(-)